MKESAMPTKPIDKTPDEGAHETVDKTRYKVLSGGISTAAGAVYQGEIVTTEHLGGADRVAKLLKGKAIEVAE
jgi:hypothetical protein